MIFILVTCAVEGEAETIARKLVEDHLAACVQIMPPHHSIYRWDGKIEETREVNILIKTRAALFEDVRQQVEILHSYDVPCIVSWEADKGHAPYLEWLAAQTVEK